ncbi:MAG: hypothetical protein ABSF46_30685, partial [Terriglobia bacterium]
APSGAVNINATFRPTAHAVGYFLAPLRGFRSPGALSKRLCRLALPYTAEDTRFCSVERPSRPWILHLAARA